MSERKSVEPPPNELWIGFGDFGDYVFHSPIDDQMLKDGRVHRYVLAAPPSDAARVRDMPPVEMVLCPHCGTKIYQCYHIAPPAVSPDPDFEPIRCSKDQACIMSSPECHIAGRCLHPAVSPERDREQFVSHFQRSAADAATREDAEKGTVRAEHTPGRDQLAKSATAAPAATAPGAEDIVARLTDMSLSCSKGQRGDIHCEAAAAITALRAQLAEAREEIARWRVSHDDLHRTVVGLMRTDAEADAEHERVRAERDAALADARRYWPYVEAAAASRQLTYQDRIDAAQMRRDWRAALDAAAGGKT